MSRRFKRHVNQKVTYGIFGHATTSNIELHFTSSHPCANNHLISSIVRPTLSKVSDKLLFNEHIDPLAKLPLVAIWMCNCFYILSITCYGQDVKKNTRVYMLIFISNIWPIVYLNPLYIIMISYIITVALIIL